MPSLLVVDDEPLNCEIIADFLDDERYDLSFAGDGMAALEALEAAPERFDAVILDRRMPRMDGMELLRRLRADARFDSLPVVMQTAAGEPAEVAEGLAAGAWYYLAKPYTGAALNRIVRAALYDRKNRQELARVGQELQGTLNLLRRAGFDFRTPDEARMLAVTLARLCADETSVAMGLSELMLNAVEHGNLGIGYQEKSALIEAGTWQEEIERRLADPAQAPRSAVLEIERDGEWLYFTIRDRGKGFDWREYLELSPARAFDSHGRGIAMARMLAFAALEYQGSGNTVRVSARPKGPS